MPKEEEDKDECVKLMVGCTEEGKKVERMGKPKYWAVYRRKLEDPAPPATLPPVELATRLGATAKYLAKAQPRPNPTPRMRGGGKATLDGLGKEVHQKIAGCEQLIFLHFHNVYGNGSK